MINVTCPNCEAQLEIEVAPTTKELDDYVDVVDLICKKAWISVLGEVI